METRIQAFYPAPLGTKFITIFGYSTKGVPGVEINGFGKFGKNLKEKIIYLNKIRRIRVPVRRIAISLDANDLDQSAGPGQLKWLELPALLAFWHLIGALPAATLEDCLCSGEIKVGGEIIHPKAPQDLRDKVPAHMGGDLKIIQSLPCEGLFHLDSEMFLEGIPGLSFRTQA